MRTGLVLLLVGCGSSSPTTPDGPAEADAGTHVDAAHDANAGQGFGVLSGACGVLAIADFTGAAPELFRSKLTFAMAYVDATDRSMLTPGGQRMMATPNAGGSSGISEAFAYEQLARCEHADLLHTETEIMYATPGKITDLEVAMMGHKIGVSVTRAVAFPFGSTYTLSTATTLIQRKLTDIQASSMNVAAADKWDKQILAVLAWDDAAADTVMQAWQGLDASVKADTIVVVTATDGDDMFIYSNM